MLPIAHDDAVWKALADPTRRQILECLSLERAPLNTGELTKRFFPKLVRTAVMKHLDVLEAAKLIRIRRVGRTRLNYIETQPLKSVATWLESRLETHQTNLIQLKNIAEDQKT